MEILSTGLVDLRNKPHEFRSSMVKLNIFVDFQRETNFQTAEKYRFAWWTMDNWTLTTMLCTAHSFKFCAKSHCQGPLEWATDRWFFIELIFFIIQNWTKVRFQFELCFWYHKCSPGGRNSLKFHAQRSNLTNVTFRLKFGCCCHFLPIEAESKV